MLAPEHCASSTTECGQKLKEKAKEETRSLPCDLTVHRSCQPDELWAALHMTIHLEIPKGIGGWMVTAGSAPEWVAPDIPGSGSLQWLFDLRNVFL